MNNDNRIIWTEQELIGKTPKVGEYWVEKSNKRRWYVAKVDFDSGLIDIDTIRYTQERVTTTAIERDVLTFEAFFERFEAIYTINFKTYEQIGPMVINTPAIRKLGKFRV